MRRQRYLSTLVLLATLALFNVGCQADRHALTPEGKVPVRFSVLLISVQQTAFFQWAEEEFERRNPDIDLIFEQFPGSSLKDFEIKMRLRFASGQSPDVFGASEHVAADFARLGLLSPAPPALVAAMDTLALNEAVRNAPIVDGTTIGVTSDIVPTALYYNKRMFREAGLDPEQPPTNWAELLDYAERLTIRDEDGRLVQAGISLRKTGFKPGTAEKFLTFVYSAGGRMFDDAGTQTYINSPAGRAALEFYKAVLFDRQLDSVHLEGDQQGFGQERVAMFIREIHVDRWLRTNYPTVEFGVAPLPANPESISAGGAYVYVVSGESPFTEAAWKWVSFISSPEIYGRYAAIGGMIPVLKPVAEALSANDPTMQVFMKQALRPIKPFPRMQQALEILGAYIERYCYGQMTIDEVLTRSEREINALLSTNR